MLTILFSYVRIANGEFENHWAKIILIKIGGETQWKIKTMILLCLI